jgi:phosphate-selective porin OprO/OprP
MEQDFAAGTNLDGLRDLYVARAFGGGSSRLTIGHFKPFRSMEELTSSNEILMMERPFASATGLFGGRQFQQGVGYQLLGPNYTAGISVFNLRGAASPRNEGMGASARATWAPIMSGTQTLHLGGWVSHENANAGSANLSASANYAGRRGPSQTIASTTGISGEQVDALGVERLDHRYRLSYREAAALKVRRVERHAHQIVAPHRRAHGAHHSREQLPGEAEHGRTA